ncbi:MAG: alpha/beta fold hydrolase [Promethearchaeota archaeon]
MPFINVNQMNIFYYDNKFSGIPLLFIHGWLGSSLEWCYQLYHFNFKNHIIILDLPGFGKSDKPNIDYSIDFFTNQIIDFLKLLGYNEIILIGHSLGGLIAQNIAIRKPKLVKMLILINSKVAISPSIKEKCILFWINILFKLFYSNFLKKIIKQIISPEKKYREFKKLYNNSLKLPRKIVLNSFKNMTLKFHLNKETFNISHQTLIIQGTEDKIISKSNVIETNDLISNSELKIIENGSHRVMYDDYFKVNEFIEKFISF